MAWDHHLLQPGPFQIRGMSTRVVSPENVAGRIVNMVLTRQGTLRTVVGPAQYHPRVWTDNTGGSPVAGLGDNYELPMDGIFHCRLGGNARDLTYYVGVIDDASEKYGVWVHRGWSRSWDYLIGNDSGADYTLDLSPGRGDRPTFLTQFVATPGGVVIIPQNSRVMFHDGETVLPLGYDQAPSAPTPMGPAGTFVNDGGTLADVANEGAYYVSGRNMNRAFGSCRLGSIRNNVIDIADATKKSNPLGGVIEQGEWRGATQWLDLWGNLSPMSGESSAIILQKDDNLSKDRKKDEAELADRLRIQCGWRDLAIGPAGTIARIQGRTHDLLNSGIPGMYELPSYAADGTLRLATVPDNITTFVPDNIPDSWLLTPMTKVDPIPHFKLACLAFGRLWVGNVEGAPGLIRPSMPGRWGTFQTADNVIYPDATGSEVTGMFAVAGGMLVFTETSTFLVTPSDDGQGFKASTLHSSVGCVAPNSIATLSNGLTVWMSREGFHAYDGQTIKDISFDIKDIIERVNTTWRLRACAAVDTTMGEYRVGIPVDGSAVNNLILVFDGADWKERSDVKMLACAVTRDERQLFLAAGLSTVLTTATGQETEVASIFVLDHDERGAQQPVEHEALVETHWLRAEKSERRGSPQRVTIWLRETTSGQLTVEAMRDWRETPIIHTVQPGEPRAPTLYPNDDTPTFYGDVLLGSKRVEPAQPRGEKTPVAWRERRPYWTKVDVSIPSCEVFKVRIRYTGDMEFIGISYGELDAHGGGAKLPQGRR